MGFEISGGGSGGGGETILEDAGNNQIDLTQIQGGTTPAVKATATLLVFENPADGDTLTIGNKTVTFVAGAAGADEIHIETGFGDTVSAIAAYINSNQADTLCEVVSTSNPEVDEYDISLRAITAGTAGNNIELDWSGNAFDANSFSGGVNAIVTANKFALPVSVRKSGTSGSVEYGTPTNRFNVAAKVQVGNNDVASNNPLPVGLTYEGSERQATDFGSEQEGEDTSGDGALLVGGMTFDGTNYWKARGNVLVTQSLNFESEITNDSIYQNPMTNPDGRGVSVMVNIDSITGTPSIDEIEVLGSVNGQWFLIKSFTISETAVDTPHKVSIYPGLAETSTTHNNVIDFNFVVRVTGTVGAAEAIGLSVAITVLK